MRLPFEIGLLLIALPCFLFINNIMGKLDLILCINLAWSYCMICGLQTLIEMGDRKE